MIIICKYIAGLSRPRIENSHNLQAVSYGYLIVNDGVRIINDIGKQALRNFGEGSIDWQQPYDVLKEELARIYTPSIFILRRKL